MAQVGCLGCFFPIQPETRSALPEYHKICSKCQICAETLSDASQIASVSLLTRFLCCTACARAAQISVCVSSLRSYVLSHDYRNWNANDPNDPLFMVMVPMGIRPNEVPLRKCVETIERFLELFQDFKKDYQSSLTAPSCQSLNRSSLKQRRLKFFKSAQHIVRTSAAQLKEITSELYELKLRFVEPKSAEELATEAKQRERERLARVAAGEYVPYEDPPEVPNDRTSARRVMELCDIVMKETALIPLINSHVFGNLLQKSIVSVLVRTLSGETVALTGPALTIGDLKKLLEEKQGSPRSAQRLEYEGKELSDEMFISECAIVNGSTIHCIRPKEDRKSVDPLSEAPLDVVRHIMGYLRCLSDILSMQCVSRRWRQVIDDEQVWLRLYETHFGCNEKLLCFTTWKEAYKATWITMCNVVDDRIRLQYANGFQLPLRRAIPKPVLPLREKLPPGFQAHPMSNPLELANDFLLKLSPTLYLQGVLSSSPLKPNKQLLRLIFIRYYRFLLLKVKYPKVLLIPTDDIETVWKSHLIRPEMYARDCRKLFGVDVIPHWSYATLAHNAFFYQALELTETLWREEYKCEYLCDPVNYAEKIAPWKHCRRLSLLGNVPADHYNINNAASRGYCFTYHRHFNPPGTTYSDVPLLAFLDKQTPLPETNAELPFELTVLDVVHDSDFIALHTRAPLLLVGFMQEEWHAVCLKMYEKWLFLQSLHLNTDLETTWMIDLGHQAHMTDPVQYRADCMRLFGRVLDRNPWPGKSRLAAYRTTLELWEEEYKSNMENEWARSLKAPQGCIASVYFTVQPLPPAHITSLAAAINANMCTFAWTRTHTEHQRLLRCTTCRMSEDEGVCQSCWRVCHAGHHVIADDEQTETDGFCDCMFFCECQALPKS